MSKNIGFKKRKDRDERNLSICVNDYKAAELMAIKQQRDKDEASRVQSEKNMREHQEMDGQGSDGTFNN